MANTILTNKKLDYFTDKNNISNQTLVKMVIHHFETIRKGFFDTLEFLNILECQYQYVIKNFDNSNNVISHLQELPLTDEQKHVLYGFLLLWVCRCYPDGLRCKKQRVSMKKIEKMFLEYPNDTPEKTYCTTDNYKKEDDKVQNTPPEYFEYIGTLYGWFKNKLNYEFASTEFRIEKMFNSWIENNGCYADENTPEYKQFLTIDNFKRFIKENPEILQEPILSEQKEKFIDYLNCPNESVLSLLTETLRDLLKNKRGRYVATVIEALQRKGYLELDYREFSSFYKAMVDFGITGSRQSIINYFDKIPDYEINEIMSEMP